MCVFVESTEVTFNIAMKGFQNSLPPVHTCDLVKKMASFLHAIWLRSITSLEWQSWNVLKYVEINPKSKMVYKT